MISGRRDHDARGHGRRDHDGRDHYHEGWQMHEGPVGRSSWVSPSYLGKKGGIFWTGKAALTSNEQLLGTV